MPDYKAPDIIRREKFIVDHSEVNQYGDLIVTSKNGNEYKIKAKRSQFFDVFQPDIEVVVGYANFMNRDYIAEATQGSQVVSTNTPIQEEKPPEKEKPKSQESKYKADPAKIDSIEAQAALKNAVKLASLTVIPPDKILSYAEVFKRWLNGGIEVKDEAVFTALIGKYFKPQGEKKEE